jgi:hypothetical protein
MARSFTQVGSYIDVGKHSDAARGKSDILGNGNLPFPNPVDGSITLAPLWLHEPVSSYRPLRGYMPGIWNICHNVPFQHGDTFTGTGGLAGKTFQVFNSGYGSGTVAWGQYAIEISDTW